MRKVCTACHNKNLGKSISPSHETPYFVDHSGAKYRKISRELLKLGDLKLMHRIDKLHMEFPFPGSRMLQGLLIQEWFAARNQFAIMFGERFDA